MLLLFLSVFPETKTSIQLRDAFPFQNRWIFGKVPNGLWLPPSFSESYIAIFLNWLRSLQSCRNLIFLKSFGYESINKKLWHFLSAHSAPYHSALTSKPLVLCSCKWRIANAKLIGSKKGQKRLNLFRKGPQMYISQFRMQYGFPNHCPLEGTYSYIGIHRASD